MDSVVLLLSPLDMLINAERELSIPSEEFLGLSETGDLIDSLLGCLLREALIERVWEAKEMQLRKLHYLIKE
ncbi:hypothetical protein V6N11_071680 [Hibiscus sabdariffa]|uniref:Uncharacterized protein n=1 Tax=Hibiscus sabdariffa TaxID=183260 RepID=A0ABR2U0R3_9ROSI